MLVAPATSLGIELKVLANFQDLSIVRGFAKDCDVIAFDLGQVPIALLPTFEAEGVRFSPSYDSTVAVRDWPKSDWSLLEEGCDVAVHVARSPHGQAAVWAVTELIGDDGMRKETITPARNISKSAYAQVQRMALEIAGSVALVGVMSVEMCVVDGQVFVKDVAIAPRYSGYWTIDGSLTSVFEQHLRAILDLPLGTTDLLAPFVVTANVFGTDKPDLYRPYLHVFARDPGVKVHQYGAVFGLGQDLGHVTVMGRDAAELCQRAAHAADYISGVIDE
jgi:5-(carboxyamino)imidazole ribonucleotide synthase